MNNKLLQKMEKEIKNKLSKTFIKYFEQISNNFIKSYNEIMNDNEFKNLVYNVENSNIVITKTDDELLKEMSNLLKYNIDNALVINDQFLLRKNVITIKENSIIFISYIDYTFYILSVNYAENTLLEINMSNSLYEYFIFLMLLIENYDEKR